MPSHLLSQKPQRKLSKLTQARLGLKGQVAAFLSSALAQHLQQIPAPQVSAAQSQPKNLLLAFSGGLDSSVLLHVLASLRSDLNFSLTAMHVHHGLSANADAWAEACHQTCAQLKVALEIVHVKIAGDNTLGIEAAARHLRYEALLGANADYVCLAHHQDDQAETLLLQLARGAGVKGLSAMAALDDKRGLLRPLLNIPHAQLLAYARENSLTWCEDESNQNQAFDRNFIRHHILPALATRYPAIAQTLSRSAAHLAEASSLLDELAMQDAAIYVQDNKLNIEALTTLSASRSRNLLRWWLACLQQTMPSTEQLEQMLWQLKCAKSDAQIILHLVCDDHHAALYHVTVQRYHGYAYLIKQLKSAMHENKPKEINLLWQGEPELILPDNSRLVFSEQLGQGLALKRLDINSLRVSYRKGGERFKPDANRPTRTLKHLLQETNMPPWQREWLPLIYVDEKLALVPSVGVEASMQALPNEVGIVILWI